VLGSVCSVPLRRVSRYAETDVGQLGMYEDKATIENTRFMWNDSLEMSELRELRGRGF
jgi:hypothetical protein